MVEFGAKCVISFWCLSLFVQIAKWLGLVTTSWCFLSIWGLTTIVEKTLKVIPNSWGNMACNWLGYKLISKEKGEEEEEEVDDQDGQLPPGLA